MWSHLVDLDPTLSDHVVVVVVVVGGVGVGVGVVVVVLGGLSPPRPPT